MIKKIVKQFIGFGLVGAFNTFLSYGIYLVFFKLGFHYVVCNFIAFVISVFVTFLLNRNFVFKKGKHQEETIEETIPSSKCSWVKELLKVYASYSLTSLLLSTILLSIQVEVLGIAEEIAPFINLLFTIPINFLLNKFWAFKGS